MTIGFIGQGYVGKNTADDFESRGYSVIRYALEPEYIENKEKIKECDVVFIAVPTPTTPTGFDYSIVETSLALIRPNATVVLKSTLLPGTTERLQKLFPGITVLFSPEFLCESTAAFDAAHPIFNIVGISEDTDRQKKAAQAVLDILPKSERVFLTTAGSAELFKYAHNINGYMRVILSNILYDASTELKSNWEDIQQMMQVDPMMSPYYNAPIHKSGRGAGGHCFIKDMAAFRMLYTDIVHTDSLGVEVLKAMERKNLELLSNTHKDADLVQGVYGAEPKL